MAIERWEIYFSGTVQGVGFRYRTRIIAENFPVTGWVGNLADRRVKLVVEGERDTLGQFVDQIADNMSAYIKSVDKSVLVPTGEFGQFEIRH
jgi:acylphosphatase